MNQDPADLISTKFSDRAANFVDAFLDDSTEHESETEFLDALFAVGQYLRRTVIAGRKGYQTDRSRPSTSELPGCHVWPESDLFHDLLDTLPGFIIHVRPARYDSRDRL